MDVGLWVGSAGGTMQIVYESTDAPEPAKGVSQDSSTVCPFAATAWI